MSAPDEKVHKTLLLLLCSTFPGEVMAARDAFLRLVGVGPHELAAKFLGGAQKQEGPSADRGGKRSQQRADTHVPDHVRMAKEILQFHEDGGRLSSVELGFVKDMVEWKYPSDKQMAWLERIYARVEGADF